MLIQIYSETCNLNKNCGRFSMHVYVSIPIVVPNKADSVVVALCSLLPNGYNADNSKPIEGIL